MPSLKVTVPVGLVPVIVAFRTVPWPAPTGLTLEVRVVVVAAGPVVPPPVPPPPPPQAARVSATTALYGENLILKFTRNPKLNEPRIDGDQCVLILAVTSPEKAMPVRQTPPTWRYWLQSTVPKTAARTPWFSACD